MVVASHFTIPKPKLISGGKQMPRFQVHPVKPTRRKRYHNGRLTKAPSKSKFKLRERPAVIDLASAPPILDVRGTETAPAADIILSRATIEPSTIPVVEEDMGEITGPAPIPTVVTCPLCKKPITFNDGVFNVKVIKLNGNGIQVHKTCPE
jgi:hypothetical protein